MHLHSQDLVMETVRGMTHRYHITRLMEFLNVQSFVEVGVYEGVFFERLMGVPGIQRAIAVDIWDNFPKEWLEDDLIKWDLSAETQRGHREKFQAKWAGDQRVTVLQEFSCEAAKRIPPGSIDLVYIDAQHNYEDVKADIAAWWPKVARGGILCGHDYLTNKWGVKRAVDEFVAAQGAKDRFHDFRRGGGNWFLMKPR